MMAVMVLEMSCVFAQWRTSASSMLAWFIRKWRIASAQKESCVQTDPTVFYRVIFTLRASKLFRLRLAYVKRTVRPLSRSRTISSNPSVRNYWWSIKMSILVSIMESLLEAKLNTSSKLIWVSISRTIRGLRCVSINYRTGQASYQ